MTGAKRGRPRFYHSTMGTHSLVLPDELWTEIQALAQHHGVSASEIVRALLLEGLEHIDRLNY